MKALYYLLSSSQGFPISKCNSLSSTPEPNWQNIARLIAFVSNIFPKQEEIQFSDGQYTYFSKPQSLKSESCYFVTIFTGHGPLLNLSSLSSYIGFVTSVLFQLELEECFKHLGDQITSAIQSSTYHDTIQNDSAGSGDGYYENALSSLHDIFPVLLERLSVFEEHFIRELLMSEREFYYRWFLGVSDCLNKADLSSQNCFSELYVVYHLSKDDILSSLLTVHLNQNCHNEVFIEDLRLCLIEYTRSPSSRSASLPGVNPIVSTDQQQVSHVLNVVSSHPSTNVLINDDSDVTMCSYFAVSQFPYNDCNLLVVCHVPNEMIVECFLHPISSTSANKPQDECWGAVNKSKVFPITVLPVNLCTAWNKSLKHLQRALFLNYTEADNLHHVDYYDNILLSKEAENANKIVQTVTELAPVHDENCGDDIDGIEYFPQPPDKRPEPETANTPTSEVSRAEQVVSKKTVSRPGRKYA